jgi:hypothetical protein
MQSTPISIYHFTTRYIPLFTRFTDCVNPAVCRLHSSRGLIWCGYMGVNSCQCCKSCHQWSTTVPIVPYTNASNQTVCNEKLENIYRTYSKWSRIGLQYILSYGICNRQTSWGMQSTNRGINAIGKRWQDLQHWHEFTPIYPHQMSRFPTPTQCRGFTSQFVSSLYL